MSKGNSTTLRAVGYARASTNRQEESVPDQLAWMERVCKVEGIHLVRTFSDEGIAGDETMRPGLGEMLSYVDCEFFADRQFDALVVWDLDRLSRASSLRTGAMLSRLVDAGVTRVLTRSGWMDLSNQVDLLLMNVRSDFTASGYVRSLSANVARTVLKKAKDGRTTGGRTPRGYAHDEEGRLILGKQEDVDLVREIFTTYADVPEATSTSIARDLNRRGVTTGYRGTTWRGNSILAILRNRAYLGEFRWFNRSTGKYTTVKDGEIVPTKSLSAREQAKRRKELKRLPTVKGDAVVIPNNHPPIISEELFRKVQDKIARLRIYRGPSVVKRYPLGGLMYCGGCGGSTWLVPTWNRKDRRLNVICGTHKVDGPGSCARGGRLPYQDVLRRVVEVLVNELGNPKACDSIRAAIESRANKCKTELERDRKTTEKAIAKLEGEIATATRRLLILPESVLAEAKIAFEKMQRELNDLKTQHASILERQRLSVGINAAKVDAALAIVPKLPEMLGQLDSTALRRALDALVAKVVIRYQRTEHQRATRGKFLYTLGGVDVTLTPQFAEIVGANNTMGNRVHSPCMD